MCYRPSSISFNRVCPHCGAVECNEQMFCTNCGKLMPYIPESQDPVDRVRSFFAQLDSEGVSNEEKVHANQKILRRISSTDKETSVEVVQEPTGNVENGMVFEGGKLIGLGIHIFNEDIYPLQSFEIYLRSCGLAGQLNLSGCTDLLFVDLYHNQIEKIVALDLPKLRIFGVQDNLLSELDVSFMPACLGIDAGKNMLEELDVSYNRQLVELYVNENRLTQIDLSENGDLKYFYCHGNQLTRLDTTANPLLRHLNATENPLKEIRSLAPQRDQQLPLELYAGEGGFVGLKFNPVYNAQWKETGEWQQSYVAYPQEGCQFEGWFDQNGVLLSTQETWVDEYGTSRVLTARFSAC